MANRRMLQKSYSYNEGLNDASDFEKVLFLLAIPHLDDFGRISGNARVFKSMVLPMDVRPSEEYEKALVNLESCKLIASYESEGEKVILYPKFEDEQTGLDKRTRSRYPGPPEELLLKYRNILRTSDATEPNPTQENLEEENSRERGRVPYKNREGGSSTLETRVIEIAKDVGITKYDYLLTMAEEGEIELINKAYKEYENATPHTNVENPPAYFKKILIRLIKERGSRNS
jgi:hypothetical protein